MIGAGLSGGTLRPAGKVALSGLDLASNAIWMTPFAILHVMSLVWSCTSIYKLFLIEEWLEPYPVLFRIYFLTSGTLMILTNAIFGIVSIPHLGP